MGLRVTLTLTHVSVTCLRVKGAAKDVKNPAVSYRVKTLRLFTHTRSLSPSLSLGLIQAYAHTQSPSLIQFSSCCHSLLSDWWLRDLSCVKGQQAPRKEGLSCLFLKATVGTECSLRVSRLTHYFWSQCVVIVVRMIAKWQRLCGICGEKLKPNDPVYEHSWGKISLFLNSIYDISMINKICFQWLNMSNCIYSYVELSSVWLAVRQTKGRRQCGLCDYETNVCAVHPSSSLESCE